MRILIVVYLAAIVIANLLTATYGPAVSVVNAFLLIGLDLTSRDRLHEYWHGKNLIRNMGILIASGSALSVVLNWHAGQIAIASFTAFALSAIADAGIYHLLRKRDWFAKVNGSNLASAAVDSIVFPSVAFGFPLLWVVMIGQFVAKVAGGFLWSLVVRR